MEKNMASDSRPIVSLVNAIYYREFTDQIAQSVVDFFQEVNLDEVSSDKIAYFELLSLPYKIRTEVSSYDGYENVSYGSDTGKQVAKRIVFLADVIYTILYRRLRGEVVTGTVWLEKLRSLS
jgi:hypothetical protein